jgi:aminoglycoside phosphotransferase (APT) family kinase protein
MESATKNRQPPDVIRAMIDRAYGPGQVRAGGEPWVTELEHGWFNVAYRVRLRDGSEVVLKIAPSPAVEVMTHERGAMATELRALSLIRQHTTVPVPEVHFADQSHELCDADYFFMPFVDAHNLGIVKTSLPRSDLEAYQEVLGRANRELNSIAGPAFGPLDGGGDPSWRVVFTGMVEEVLRDGERRQVDLGWDYDVVRTVVSENASCLDEVVEPRFVEWDLWDSNVMVRDGTIVSILDHERAFYGDPLIEAGFVATQLPAFGDPTAFIRGYRGHTDTHQFDWARLQLSEAMALLGRPEPVG